MAIITANNNRGYADKYPLISDAPISDFDSIKAKAFLIEAANTFSQSILIVKDFLVEDPSREDRYMVDLGQLSELGKSLKNLKKNLTVSRIDIPDNLDRKNRKSLMVKLSPVIK